MKRNNNIIERKNKGITLVALVITIIILLLLAGITINSLTGSGLFENAKLAKERTKEKEEEERIKIEEYGNEVGKYIDGDRNNTTNNVLWRKTDTVTEDTISWSESIENYKYLIIQLNHTGTAQGPGAVRDFIMDVETIKEKGYITENFGVNNAHFFLEMNSGYTYITFISDKSLAVKNYDGDYSQGINAINKLIGIK